MIGERGQFDRSLLPPLVAYVEQCSKVVGRGRQRRADCLLADHSHRLTMTLDVERGLYFCHACDVGGDVLDLHRRRFGLGFIEAARELGALVDENGPVGRVQPAQAPIPRPTTPDPDDERKRAMATRIWPETKPPAQTPVELYLGGRGGALTPPDGDLRYHPDLRLFGFAGPAMVGRISDVHDPRHGLGLHITWLCLDGERWTRGERRYLGKKTGGVIRLWPDEAVTTGLAVAEGIETALAAARVFTPIWATMDAGNLARFPVLDGIESLTVFADRDASGTGQRAAADCAQRWRDADRRFRVLAAIRTGADMADLVAEVA